MPRARDVALKVLCRVEVEGAFAAAALAAELGPVRDPREAALATELVLGVLRRRPWLDRVLAVASTRDLRKLDPEARRILRLGAYQLAFLERIPARAVVFEAVDEARHRRGDRLAGVVNAVLRRVSELPAASLRPPAGDDGAPLRELAARAGLPDFLFERFVGLRGRLGALALAAAFDGPARRTLRINGGREARDRLLGEASLGGATAGRLVEWALDVPDARAAGCLVDEGEAAFQDEGAQLAALAADPASGERVLDACAGRGGKTAALAMLMGGRGSITAADKSAAKLERLAFELDRQGFRAEAVAVDLAAGPGPLEPVFDRILLDAPCSGTGTLGRRPEIRWRLEPENITSLVELQSRLLDTAAGLVRPGGRLTYAVCSLLPEEGLAHAAPFLARHPGFAPVASAPAPWPRAVPWSDGAVTIDPIATATDGYQILCFERAP